MKRNETNIKNNDKKEKRNSGLETNYFCKI